MAMERVIEMWYGNWMKTNSILLTIRYPLWDFGVAASRPDRFAGIKLVRLNVYAGLDAELLSL